MTEQDALKKAIESVDHPQSTVFKEARKDIPEVNARAHEALAVLAETHPVTKVAKPKRKDNGGDNTPVGKLKKTKAKREKDGMPPFLKRERTPESDAIVQKLVEADKARRTGKGIKNPPNVARKKATQAKDGVRQGTKLAIVVGLLRRPKGCTAAEVLKATGWPSVSMPQQARAAGLKLLKEKKSGEVTRYRAG